MIHCILTIDLLTDGSCVFLAGVYISSRHVCKFAEISLPKAAGGLHPALLSGQHSLLPSQCLTSSRIQVRYTNFFNKRMTSYIYVLFIDKPYLIIFFDNIFIRYSVLQYHF